MISVINNDNYDMIEFFDDILYKIKEEYKNEYDSYCEYITTKIHEYAEYHEVLNDIEENILEKIIKKTANFVQEKKFVINPSKYYVEFHEYHVNGRLEPFFDFHKDDNGGVSFNTVTCIYYLVKDISIKGGDLEFENDRTIKIVSNMLVIFDGNLSHRPTIMNGKGLRKSIVIQFERL